MEQAVNRAGYLQSLCNKYGDFKVAVTWKNDKGELCWTKHRSVLDCWHSDEGIDFLRRANHRSILPNEIVIDLDDNPTEKRMNEICDALEAGGETYKAYFTGSRGYHIHIFWYQYALLDKLSREGIRGKIISMFKADVLKSSDKVMIAVEGMPHWKTGNMKKLVRQYPKTWDD